MMRPKHLNGKLITSVTVTDPDTGEPVNICIYKIKDEEGYGDNFVGLDGRLLGETEDGVNSPYQLDDNLELNLED